MAVRAADAAGEVLAGGLSHAPVHWLPEEPAFRCLADPFPWRGRDHLHIFLESYDYATRHGTIDLLTLDDGFRMIDQRPRRAPACPASGPPANGPRCRPRAPAGPALHPS